MNKLNNILAGIDFSDCSRSALQQAVRLAKWNNARLHALHSIEYLTLSDAAWASHIPQEQLEQDAVAEAKRSLHQWLREAQAGAQLCRARLRSSRLCDSVDHRELSLQLRPRSSVASS